MPASAPLLPSTRAASPCTNCKPGWEIQHTDKCCGSEPSDLKVSAEIVVPSMSLQPRKIHSNISIPALSFLGAAERDRRLSLVLDKVLGETLLSSNFPGNTEKISLSISLGIFLNNTCLNGEENFA